MTKLIIYVSLLLCLTASKMFAQGTFESQAKTIALKIENITIEEKAALKTEVESVNVQLEKGVLNKEQANVKKQRLAQFRATIIENKIAVVQEELKDLIQQKVDGKIKNQDTLKMDRRRSVKIYLNERKSKNDTIEKLMSERRTTSQLVFATGLNNVVTDKSIQNSDFRYLGSHFYEWGLTYNSRIFKDANLLHAKYGLSVMYNNLRATDNRSFVVNGVQTNLEVNPVNPEDSRFRTVSLVIPMHLEFDFSKSKEIDGKTYFKTHDSFRVGFGGYFGTNLKSKQIINYDESNYKTRERVKGDFNVSNFVYGLSTYIGYKSTSLYLKYDLNPLFTDNTVKQNNVSLGLRFDFN